MATSNDDPISSDELTDFSDSEASTNEPSYLALMRQVRTEQGAEVFVQSIVQHTVLSSDCDWGALLSSAPKALCYMGQCFVVASSPIAASLQLPHTAVTGARSLRANLVQCSDLGRSAFREAESKLGSVSMAAQKICEPNGTIDKILAAIEDDEVEEVTLQRQLRNLERISQNCVDDTNAIKEKVAAWKDFVVKIRVACEDENQKATSNEQRLEKENQAKQHTREMKKKEVAESQEQTQQYRLRLEERKKEYDQSEKKVSQSTWIDLGEMVVSTTIKAVSTIYSPFPMLQGFLWNRGSTTKAPTVPKQDEEVDVARLSTEDGDDEDGYKLARDVNPLLNDLKTLLASGNPSNHHGLDWRLLLESSGYQDNSADITDRLRDHWNNSIRSPTPIDLKVREFLDPVIETGERIIRILREQSNTLGFNENYSTNEDMLNNWKNCTRNAVNENLRLLAEGNAKAKKRNSKAQSRRRRHGSSKTEIKFERFQQAQEALFQAEEMLSKRRESERKANEEFDRIQRELTRLSNEKLNVGKVKDILQKCIRNLEQFTERLDDLNKFFTQIHQLIQHIHDYRVDELIGEATDAQKMLDRISADRRDKKKEQLIGALRINALTLRGYYLVAQGMAKTYVDISSKHIIPGINQADRLLIADDSTQSETSLSNKLGAVLVTAQKAQDEIQKYAQKRKQEILDQLVVARGEAQEVKELENGVADWDL